MAVRSAHALLMGDVASERADTLTRGQRGCSGRLCLPVILQLHLCLLHQQGILHHPQTVIAMRERETIMCLASQMILFAFQADRELAPVLGLSGSVVSLFSLAI